MHALKSFFDDLSYPFPIKDLVQTCLEKNELISRDKKKKKPFFSHSANRKILSLFTSGGRDSEAFVRFH